MEEKLKTGDKYYLSNEFLNLRKVEKDRIFKVQILKVLSKNVIVLIKHFKTKECNKVRLTIEKEVLNREGTYIGGVA